MVSAAVDLSGLEVRWAGARGAPSTTVLDGFDLTVERGEFVALVGPSGCGKSTILRILAGLLAPNAGEATVGGASVVGRPGACAWLPQRDALLPWRTVLDNAVLGVEVASGRSAARAARGHAAAVLERFGLGAVLDAWPTELSGGMRQRVAVLRTLLAPAPVLLLDEPFGALDALTRREVQIWLQEVLAGTGADGVAGGRTTLLVTHDVEEALLLADRVVVLSSAPAAIVASLEVGFARPRAAVVVDDPAFVALRRTVLDALGAR